MVYIYVTTLLTVLLSAVIHLTASFEFGVVEAPACPGGILKARCTNGILQLRSITVYSTTNSSAIIDAGTRCFTERNTLHQCERRITVADTGLSGDYRYLYKFSQASCSGKVACDPIQIPEWWNLIGNTNKNAEINKDPDNQCPVGGTKYVSGLFYDFSCRGGETIAEVTKPPPTTPRTRATTPTTTPGFDVAFKIYLPALEDQEKIILGVAIGLAIAILIVLLTILYCWERWRRNKKFGKLLRMLGRPQPMDDGFDELDDYGRADAWKGEAENPDALGEYTGVKPDEFLTIDRKAMENSGLIYSDHVGTITTMGRANTASTLNRHGNGSERPSVQAGTGHHNGAVDYDTTENLELEERMAAVLSQQNQVLGDADGEEVTKY